MKKGVFKRKFLALSLIATTVFSVNANLSYAASLRDSADSSLTTNACDLHFEEPANLIGTASVKENLDTNATPCLDDEITCAPYFSINASANCTTSVNENQPYYSSPRLKTKNQIINGPCWAFANIATLETFLSKKGLLRNNSLSEKHLLSWANQTSCNPGYHIPIHNGSSLQTASDYFMSVSGPVFEQECRYNTNNTQFNSQLAALKPKYWVKGIENINTDIKSIKKAISTYGAATIVYNVRDDLYHAVSAIGWDDRNHRWLVKDSAKTSNNYSSLPYSTKIYIASCITDAETFQANQKIYQHDNLGVTGSYGNDSSFTVANVYNFDGNETLNAVTVNSTSPNAKITLFFAPVLNNGTPNGNPGTWKQIYSGTIPYSGYFTCQLKNKINLNKGKYAIIAQIEKTSASTSPNIGCQLPNNYLTVPNSYSGKCFALLGCDFYDVTNVPNLKSVSAFSLKAVTNKN